MQEEHNLNWLGAGNSGLKSLATDTIVPLYANEEESLELEALLNDLNTDTLHCDHYHWAYNDLTGSRDEKKDVSQLASI